VNTITATFDTNAGQLTEMSQRKKTGVAAHTIKAFTLVTNKCQTRGKTNRR